MDASRPRVALSRLRPLAVALLVALTPAWAGAQPARVGEQQDDPPRHYVASTNADGSWRPSAAQREAIEAVTRAFFAARDADQAEEAYAFVSPSPEHHRPPLATFRSRISEFNAKAGEVRARRLRAATWYKDTPQAGPGLYVAVDFASDFSNLALHCGYVIWQEQPDGSFLLTRQEENQISIAMMARLTPDDLTRVRAQYRC